MTTCTITTRTHTLKSVPPSSAGSTPQVDCVWLPQRCRARENLIVWTELTVAQH
jgi:hypothetical protein